MTTTLQGTERQIAAAGQIRSEIIEKLTAWAGEQDPDLRFDMEGRLYARMWQLKIVDVNDFVDFLNAQTSAAAIIDHFGRGTIRFRTFAVYTEFQNFRGRL